MHVYVAAPRKGMYPMWDEMIVNILSFIGANGHNYRTQFDPVVFAPTLRTTAADMRTVYNEAAYGQMVNWLAVAECLIAECSNESCYVGATLQEASRRGLPILILHKEGTHLDPVIAGLPFVEMTVWEDLTDIQIRIIRFLKSIDDKLGG